MTETNTQISVRGRQTSVPLVRLQDVELITTGRWLRIAGVRDEDYFEGDPVANPEKLLEQF